MSFWNKVSDATRVKGPVADAVRNPTGGLKAPKWFGPYMFVGIVGFLFWAVWSGAAQEFLDTLKARLLNLVPSLAVDLAIVAILAFLVGWTLMKAPKGHFLAEHGKRLIWVAPAAIVAAAAIVPVAMTVMTVTSTQTTKMAAAFTGQQPAANLCQAAGLAEGTPPPAPHR